MKHPYVRYMTHATCMQHVLLFGAGFAVHLHTSTLRSVRCRGISSWAGRFCHPQQVGRLNMLNGRTKMTKTLALLLTMVWDSIGIFFCLHWIWALCWIDCQVDRKCFINFAWKDYLLTPLRVQAERIHMAYYERSRKSMLHVLHKQWRSQS